MILHVVYFRRLITVYRIVGFTTGNEDSTGYLVIQLSVVRAMSGLWRHTSHLLCGAVVSVIRAVGVLLQRQGVLDRDTGHARYPFKIHALQ